MSEEPYRDMVREGVRNLHQHIEAPAAAWLHANLLKEDQ